MVSPARRVALTQLLRCEAAGQYANLSLDAALKREDALSEADRALATALFYAVIEHRITLDAVIDELCELPPAAIENKTRMILRLALAQLLYFDRIPDHAAVFEAAEAADTRSRGFVNALLRRFCRSGKSIPLPNPKDDLTAYLSVRYSVRPDICDIFLQRFGREQAESVLTAFSHPPAVTVRVNTLRLTRAEFLSRVPGGVETRFAPHGVILPAGAPLSDLLDAGLCFVQDEASQLAVEALKTAGKTLRVLDLCAAPGSKSFGAAIDMENRGEILSLDLHENKLSLIRSGCERLGIRTVRTGAADARKVTAAQVGLFDRVLCDVPCSGLGVLGKKPDIRYKDPAGFGRLPAVQADILASAAQLVRPGGLLVYSTCTLIRAENEAQIESFLAVHPDFVPESSDIGLPTADGMLTLRPDENGTDGFFIAVLRKKEELS